MNLGRSFFRLSTWLITLFVLQACGGSGGASEKYTISANLSDISFQNEVFDVNEQSFEIQVSYKGDGLLLGFAPGSQPVDWLDYQVETVSSERSIIHVTVENSRNGGFLPSGDYNTTMRLSTGDTANSNLVHHDIDISLYIWQLLTSTEQLSFSETFGATEVEDASFTITSSESAPTSWSLSSDVSWLSFSASEGTGTTDISVTADPSAFARAGLNTATITITEPETGETKTIAVDLGLDSLRLFADDNAIAFSQFSNTSKLVQSLSVNSNAYTEIAWQASTEATWLNLSIDSESNTLQLTVDSDNGLEHGFYQTQITVSAITDGEAQSDVIPVSFYKAESVTDIEIESYTPNTAAQVTDPLRPYLYIAQENRLRVYQVYTGELISEYPLMMEVTTTDDDGNEVTELQEVDYPISNFVMHPRASTLFLQATETQVDETDPENPITTETVHNLTFDLESFVFTELKDVDIQTRPNHITRLDGLYFMVTEAVEFADLNLVRQDLLQDNIYFVRDMASAWGANSLFTLDSGATTFRRYTGQANEFLATSLQVELTHEYTSETTTEREIPPENEGEDPTIIPASNIFSFDLSKDESNLYVISDEIDWISFDGENFTDQALLNTEDVRRLDVFVSDENRPYFLNFDATSGIYLTIFDTTQHLASNSLLPVTSAGSLLVSHDDNRLILENSGSELAELVTVQQFNLSTETLTFEAINGNTGIAEQTIEITGLGAGWQVSSDADWLTVSPLTGDGDATLTVSVNTSGLTPGIHTATITIFDPSTGQTRTIVVTFAVDENRLFANDNAVAFVKTNDFESLSQTVSLLTNSQTLPEWQANTSAEWLTLTQSGDTLTITADATGLAEDIYQTNISLTATDGTQVTAGEIQVALTVLTQEVEASVNIAGILPNSGALAADPLRPYTYIGQLDEIQVLHNYTGEVVTTIDALVADSVVESFVILSDGSTMYFATAATDDEGEATTHYFRLDLTSYEITQIDPELVDIRFTPAYATRIGGVDILVTSALEYADINLTSLYWDSSITQLPQALSSPSSKDELFVKSNDTIEQFGASYNGVSDEKVKVESLSVSQSDNYSSVRDLSVDSDGGNIYTSGVDSEWSSFNGDNYTDNGVLYSEDISSVLTQHVMPDDSFYLYRFDGAALYLTGYNTNQEQVSEQNVGTIFPQLTYFSGDNKRIILQGSSLGIPTIQINTIE